jgi:hypothetical protein
MLDSNEKLLDAFRRLILGDAISNTPPIDDGGDWEKQIMPPERFQYHQNLAFLQDSDAFINLKGKLSIRALSGQDALDLAAYLHGLDHSFAFHLTSCLQCT